MRILDSAATREVDRRASEEFGIPSLVLMENAALGVVEALCEAFPTAERVLVLCGPGNNGGDGLAVARHLDLRGFAVDVVLVGERELSGDAGVQETICRRQGVPISRVTEAGALPRASRRWEVVVDALFGVGLSRPLEGLFARAVEWLGSLEAPCLSIDLPSGLDADDPSADQPHAVASVTVTFETPKPAHVLPPACDAVGNLIVADLGIPPVVAGEAPGDLWLLTRELVAGWLPRRRRSGHKGSYGHVLVVAGSKGMGGAAVLAARGAIRGGAGLVTCAVPEVVLPVVDAASLESMTLGLPATGAGAFAEGAAAAVVAAARERDVVALGPGLGAGEETGRFVLSVVEGCDRPLVLDASAFDALAGKARTLRRRPAPTVMTPHPGELARLLGRDREAITADRLGSVERAVEETGAVVLLKGQATLIGAPGGTVYVNSTGNPGLATGGTGDVLTGLVAALWGQGLDAAAAAALAAWVHGAAADRAVEETGETALAASDLLPLLPRVLRELEGA